MTPLPPMAPTRRPRPAPLRVATLASLASLASLATLACLACLLPRPATGSPSTPTSPPPSDAAPAIGSPAPATPDTPKAILILGAAGESEFGTNFLSQIDRWQRACQLAGWSQVTLGTPPPDQLTDLERLRRLLEAEPRDGLADLWLVLIGHGTFDGKTARFNLRGPDLAAEDLATWLRPFQRPLAVINTASSSAPFLPALAASNRVVITATRSGHEQNFTRFGEFLADTVIDPKADLDGDAQTSLLEAFLGASFRVAEFYQTEGRLATEHALLDDNGDGLGTPADWFRGLVPTKRPRDRAALDGIRAHQFHLLRSPAENALSPATRARRDALERELARLRETKPNLPEEEYYRRLETILVSLARLYDTPVDAPSPAP